MTLIDGIVLVLIVALVASRFFAFKLPKDTRPKASRRSNFNIFGLNTPAEPKTETSQAQTPQLPPPPLVKRPSTRELSQMSGIEQIKALEPEFKEEKFIEGVKAALHYFYRCWNKRDEAAMADVVAPRLMAQIKDMWDSTNQPKKLEDTKGVLIKSARVTGRTSIIETEITLVSRDGKKAPRTLKGAWTWARPIGSEDPNWELQSFEAI